jgi:hypothetical protein
MDVRRVTAVGNSIEIDRYHVYECTQQSATVQCDSIIGKQLEDSRGRVRRSCRHDHNRSVVVYGPPTSNTSSTFTVQFQRF